MQILLANAKMMFPVDKVNMKPVTVPMFQPQADMLAMEMARMDVDELAKQLDCSRHLAQENWHRYQQFPLAERMPAIMAYNGQAYKHLKANTLSNKSLEFGQRHLWITCFLYGLLRPLDGVVPYRMERTVTLEATGDKPVNQFWRDKLTDVLIDSVRADDGTLIHLSTEEYEHLFDWKRIIQELKVIKPLFFVKKNGELKTQAVWAKACRGAMTRMILEQRLTQVSHLCAFSYEGFKYNPILGEEAFPHFVRE